jgi:hypothetical protein
MSNAQESKVMTTVDSGICAAPGLPAPALPWLPACGPAGDEALAVLMALAASGVSPARLLKAMAGKKDEEGSDDDEPEDDEDGEDDDGDDEEDEDEDEDGDDDDSDDEDDEDDEGDDDADDDDDKDAGKTAA